MSFIQLFHALNVILNILIIHLKWINLKCKRGNVWFWAVTGGEMLPRLVLRLCTHNFKITTYSNIDSPIFYLLKLPLSGV